MILQNLIFQIIFLFFFFFLIGGPIIVWAESVKVNVKIQRQCSMLSANILTPSNLWASGNLGTSENWNIVKYFYYELLCLTVKYICYCEYKFKPCSALSALVCFFPICFLFFHILPHIILVWQQSPFCGSKKHQKVF